MRDVAAIAERIFPGGPGGPGGPGATEARVGEYIRRQLEGPWGRGEHMYRAGPFLRPNDPGHGWQSELTPAEVYRIGLQAVTRHSRSRHGRRFADLRAADQDQVLTDLASGAIEVSSDFGGREFFELVRRNVIEGLFADPVYGGNHGMVGWRWIGYPGVASEHGGDYAERIERHREPYVAEPKPLP